MFAQREAESHDKVGALSSQTDNNCIPCRRTLPPRFLTGVREGRPFFRTQRAEAHNESVWKEESAYEHSF